MHCLVVIAAGALVAGFAETEVPAAGNVINGCVSTFDVTEDYFPDKAFIEDAGNLRVEYHRSYKVVTVTDGRAAGPPERYVLVQCGTPPPRHERATQIVTIPIGSIFASSTQLSALIDLERLELLTGVPRIRDLSGEPLTRRVATGRVREFAARGVVDVELVASQRPSLFMSSGGSGSDAVLRNAGVPVVANTDWLESTALGRAEWMKFIALFLNEELKVQRLFDAVKTRYHALRARARSDANQPRVMAGRGTNGMFVIAGGRSYVAALIADAAGQYVWADNQASGTAVVDLEAQIARAANADIWINGGGWSNLADLVRQEPRYAAFKAFRTRQVWVYERLLEPSGANEYWTRSSTHPDLVLADLVGILHPELMPGHRFEWYLRVPQ
jgi:iron complex transport system substrate-binding protein